MPGANARIAHAENPQRHRTDVMYGMCIATAHYICPRVTLPWHDSAEAGHVLAPAVRARQAASEASRGVRRVTLLSALAGNRVSEAGRVDAHSVLGQLSMPALLTLRT